MHVIYKQTTPRGNNLRKLISRKNVKQKELENNFNFMVSFILLSVLPYVYFFRLISLKKYTYGRALNKMNETVKMKLLEHRTAVNIVK